MKNKTFIIAEAGVNHNGSLKKAYKLIDAAKNSGADAIKFQSFKSDKLVDKSARKAEYQIKNTKDENNQFNMLKKLELSFEDHLKLKKYCDKTRIEYLSTPFEENSLKELIELKVSKIKVSSGDLNNIPFLIKIAKTKVPIILSTGMSNLKEIKNSVRIISKFNKKITILHCTTEYPAPYNEINLNVLKTFLKEFNFPIGYSDHTEGIEVSIAAVALGASVIEKHFTLDKTMPGPDHRSSLEPDEFKSLVTSIRNIELSLGDTVKKITKSEAKNKKNVRKSLTYIKDLQRGHRVKLNDISAKRPEKGISPDLYLQIINKKLKYDVTEGSFINIKDFEKEN